MTSVRTRAAAVLLVLLLPASARSQSAEPPSYRCRFVAIPMRDGARLHTSVCEPTGAHPPLPFLITRTPYGIAGDTVVSHGYRVRYWPLVDVVHVGAGSNAQGRRPAKADEAYFRTMAPFIRKHRPGLRGHAYALVVAGAAETMYVGSRLRTKLVRRSAAAGTDDKRAG